MYFFFRLAQRPAGKRRCLTAHGNSGDTGVLGAWPGESRMKGALRSFTARVGLRPVHLLPAGAVFGLGLAALGAVAPRPAELPKDAAALVNGVPIRRADHERAVEAMAAGKRNPLDTEDRRHALSRLIDEELLIQRGVELGLHRSDPMARKRLVAAMLEWIAADASGEPVPEDDLHTFYKENQALFTRTARAEVDWFHIARSEQQAETRVREARERLSAGLAFAETAEAFGSPAALRLPDGLLPPAKLRDYLGPSLTRTAMALKPGEAVGPIARADGWHFLLLRRRERADPPAFGAARAEVRSEYLRVREDKAVRAYLRWLRRRAEIVAGRDTGQ